MGLDENDLVVAARSVLSDLDALAGAQAPELRADLEALLAAAADGKPVKIPLLRVLRRHPAVRAHVDSQLGVRADERTYQQLAGPVRPPAVPRYRCPHGDRVWYRFDVAEPIPTCSAHGVRLELATE